MVAGTSTIRNGEGHREQQPSIGHQAVVVKRDLDAIGMVAW